jgi:hypothetical protein
MKVALLIVLAACAVAAPRCAAAGRANGSLLALSLVEGPREPSLVLAQRTIARTWGESEESTYVVVSVPDWKSEPWALALSGVVPGAGQAYLGEQSAYLFALIEVGGWLARVHFESKNDYLRSEAVRFRGDPYDSTAAWSFARWEHNTGGDPTGIQTLYERDSEDFDARIAHDPVYAAGWAQETIPPQDEFRNYLDRADGMLQRKRYASTALWFNHLAAAYDALRAARIHNFPLRQDLQLKLKTSWHSGSPGLKATLERTF